MSKDQKTQIEYGKDPLWNSDELQVQIADGSQWSRRTLYVHPAPNEDHLQLVVEISGPEKGTVRAGLMLDYEAVVALRDKCDDFLGASPYSYETEFERLRAHLIVNQAVGENG